MIQKEFEKEGFRCDPLNYDEFYDSALGYDECLFKVRAPTIDNVILTGNEYSFVPFDPRLVRQRDGTGVVKSIYNPVGGGTSKKVLAEKEAQRLADEEAAFADFAESGGMGFGAIDDFSYDPNDPYASFGDNFNPDTGGYDLGPDPGDPGGGFGEEPGGEFGGEPAGEPAGDLGGEPAADPAGDDSFGAEVPAGDDSSGFGDLGGGFRRRRLLQDDDAEYEGLADLSGCNCNMVVTYEDGDDRLADGDDDYKEKNKELKFENVATDVTGCYPADGSPGDECTMGKAKAVLMFRQFLSVNDPCEFVKRSSPFQCVREEASPLTQRLSLAYANSGLLYGVLCAMAVNYMYATKKVTLETVDIEQLQKLASMNKVSAEETPAK